MATLNITYGDYKSLTNVEHIEIVVGLGDGTSTRFIFPPGVETAEFQMPKGGTFTAQIRAVDITGKGIGALIPCPFSVPVDTPEMTVRIPVSAVQS